ncbi:MAG: hypothetical protein HRU80_03320 [Ignavibacteriales bacterium]|nr:MAG: hypothetical protein HRU80_03320 [Ignavibacteriales bacterium]
MIDLLKFRIEGYMKPPSCLEIRKEYQNNRKEIQTEGAIRNMKLTYTERGVFGNGSLAKLFFGNNIADLNYSDLTEGAEELSDSLETPLSDIHIYSMEVGFTTLMKNPSKEYLSKIMGAKGLLTQEYETGKRFLNKGSRAIKFYDKGKEIQAKKKTENIPEIRGLNFLRTEIKLNRLNTLKLPSPGKQTLKSIIQADQLMKLSEIFDSQIKEIIFMRHIADIPEKIKTQKDLEKLFRQTGIESFRKKGIDIESLISSLPVKERQKRNLRKKYLLPDYSSDIYEPSEEEKEFREKLNEKISVFRESVY